MSNEKIKFIPQKWSGEYSFFVGIKLDNGRYLPEKQFVIDKYREGFIEVNNTHKGVEFNKSEIKILDDE